MQYRPDIDGLRAVAVLAVVLFHADLGVPGGFVGVDVFFVISGYLIFSIIYEEARRGSFSLASFLERRVRRIFPALLVLTVAVLVCGWFLLLPAAYQALADSAVAVLTVWANVFFWHSTQGYFTPSIRELPLLHTWSLSLEEQFYIVVPLGLLAAAFWRRLLRPDAMGCLLAMLGAISFAGSIAAVRLYPNAAFFFLPPRAWEFLIGCLLALLPRRPVPGGKLSAEIISLVGLAFILVPCLVFTETTPFPGLAALPPCLGAALLIVSNDWPNSSRAGQKAGSSVTIAGRLLSWRPLVFIGLVSYSWYLWHWPVLAFAHYWMFEGISPGWRVALASVSFVAAILSWRFVEQPIRRRQLFQKRFSLFSATLVSLAIVLAACIFVTSSGGYPTRLPAKALVYAAGEKDRPPHYHIKAADIRAGKIPRFGKEDVPPSLLLWGDSQAYCLLPAFDELGKKLGVAGVAVTHGARAPLVAGQAAAAFGEANDLTEWGKEVVALIGKLGIKHVFLAGFWQDYTGPSGSEEFTESIIATIKAIHSARCTAWIIGQIPSHELATPRDLVRSTIFGNGKIPNNPVTQGYLRQKEILDVIARRSDATNVIFLDLASLFHDDATGLYKVEQDGRPLYYDTIHVNETTSRKLIAPWLQSQVSGTLGGSQD